MFITSCFIKKNTPELREALKRMGYILSELMHREILATSPRMVISVSKNIEDKIEGIDCGTNKPLFLALAALRDDTDKGQYFYAAEDGVARLCEGDRFEEECSSSELYHKMSVEELISYFDGK